MIGVEADVIFVRAVSSEVRTADIARERLSFGERVPLLRVVLDEVREAVRVAQRVDVKQFCTFE
jgi:hypothetical protein